MQTKLRWGILSTARIARVYVNALREARNGTLGAIASRQLSKAQAYAAENGIPKAYGSYEELLADPEIDVIYNPLPNGMHAEWSRKALQAGKHVICEKPLTGSAQECRELMAVARGSGKILAEALMYRRHPLARKAREIVRSGRLGKLMSIRSQFLAPIDSVEDVRFDSALAGGALRDLGIYCIDVIRFLAGEEPVQSAAFSNAYPGDPLVDLQTQGIMKFGSGLMAYFNCAFHAPFSCEYEVRGTEGRLLVDNCGMISWPGAAFTLKVWVGDAYEEIQVPPADHYLLTAEEFGDAILDATPLSFPIEESLRNMELIDSLLQSAGICNGAPESNVAELSQTR